MSLESEIRGVLDKLGEYRVNHVLRPLRNELRALLEKLETFDSGSSGLADDYFVKCVQPELIEWLTNKHTVEYYVKKAWRDGFVEGQRLHSATEVPSDD